MATSATTSISDNDNQDPEFWTILKTTTKPSVESDSFRDLFVSKRFLLKRYLGLTDEEIDEQAKLWDKDNGN